jgi:saccharopine dehydrogenase-like NADP-dependent oxidoreductase
MKDIGVIGNGKIGRAVASLLRSENFSVTVADAVTHSDCVQLDATDEKQVEHFVSDKDAIICAGPYHITKPVATVCAKLDKAYFDPTEDTEMAEYINTCTNSQTMMTQCGLAPGAVNIIACDLIKQFDSVDKVKMRVGALPKYPINEMGYYLTWSTVGVLNEYVNPCDILSNYKHTKAQPLDGKETVYVDGDRYEAFNTSGGASSMCKTFEGKVRSLSYKTIRYPGHCDKMQFLLEDLNLKHNKEKFVELFDQELPYTTQDVIVMVVSVIGKINGKMIEKAYHKKIYGNKNFSAIQLSTASGICANVMLWAQSELPAGPLKQEDIPFDKWISNKFGKLYAQ